MRVFGQCWRRRLVTCLMTVLTSVPFGVRAGRRMATTGVPLATWYVHRREAALVVMGIPERKLLTAMRRAERVVDVEDLKPAGLHGGAKLVDEGRTQPRRLGLARCILETADG